MSQREINMTDYSYLNNYAKNSEKHVIQIYDQISKHNALKDFYEKRQDSARIDFSVAATF